MHHVKDFYYNLKLSDTCFDYKFHDKDIKFTLEEFEHHFGLEYKGMEVCISNATSFDIKDFVKSISKYVFSNCLDLDNFQISQVKFEMCILHWIIANIFYRKPRNWERDDDLDLYLM